MSWDSGLMGTCPHCGLHVHAACEEKGTTSPVWTYCRNCAKARVIAVMDSEVDDFWKQRHGCKGCAGTLVEWDTGKCPRCKNDVKWTPIMIAG